MKVGVRRCLVRYAAVVLACLSGTGCPHRSARHRVESGAMTRYRMETGTGTVEFEWIRRSMDGDWRQTVFMSHPESGLVVIEQQESRTASGCARLFVVGSQSYLQAQWEKGKLIALEVTRKGRGSFEITEVSDPALRSAVECVVSMYFDQGRGEFAVAHYLWRLADRREVPRLLVQKDATVVAREASFDPAYRYPDDFEMHFGDAYQRSISVLELIPPQPPSP